MPINPGKTKEVSIRIPNELYEAIQREFIVSVLKASYKARAGGRYPHVVSVYDAGEAQAVENFIKKYRAKK